MMMKHLRILLLLTMLFLPAMVRAQLTATINLAPIDGVDITPDNILNFQVLCTSGASSNAIVRGVVHYRNSNLSFSYSFRTSIRPGLNTFGADMISPQWQFSSPALRELFFTYKKLPAGTYEYCVSITPLNMNGSDMPNATIDECLYHQSDETFLINLIDPEDKAVIQEYNPPLSWVANCSFVSELTYRVRVAPIQKGQNTQVAVSHNQPVYDESNIPQSSIVYPAYAKPLVANQPYAWTVDAYFKGLLIGQAEAWQFIIKQDTLPPPGIPMQSYIDIKRENGTQQLSAMGQIKLKYNCDERASDSLQLKLINSSGSIVTTKTTFLKAVYGDNRYVLDLTQEGSLKDNSTYTLSITSQNGKTYKLPFLYLNPNFH